MTFLPIVARELRVASRRASTFWIRSGAALAMIAIASWFTVVSWNMHPRELGKALFTMITASSLLYCLLSGVRFAADSLSEEKREGTLGLLFLTDLKGYDVVLGKLASSSLNAFYVVFALLPVAAVPLLMGGVSIHEFLRASIVCVNTLFFSVCIGIACSALTKSSRTAMSATFLFVFLVTAVLPGVGAWLAALGKIKTFHPLFFWPSPGFAFTLAFDFRFPANPTWFWWSVGLIHSMGWAALALASVIVPLTWQDRVAGERGARWGEWKRRLTHGDRSSRKLYRRELLDQNAFFWLASRARFRVAVPWVVLVALAAGWIWGYWKFKQDWLNEGIYMATAIVLLFLIKVWFASEASRQIAEDRQNGTLELVLSTPLTINDILTGQLLALRRHFLGPVTFVVCVLVILAFSTLSESMGESERQVWTKIWVGMLVMLGADLLALYYVSMWDGLTMPNPNRAANTSLTRILVLPWGMMAVLLLLVALSAMQGGVEPSGELFLNAWLFFGLGTDLVFALWARSKLLNEFRLAAAKKFTPQRGFFKRLFNAQ